MKVECDVVFQDVENESGRLVAGVAVSCARCGHTVEAYGTTERSVRRCFMLLKEQCPNGESNYYDKSTSGLSGRNPQRPSPAHTAQLTTAPSRFDYTIPRLIRENKFAILKTETTGLSPTEDQIVRLGIIQVDYGQPRWRSSINVKPTCEVSPGASKVHGLTAEMLAFCPTMPEIAQGVLAKLDGRIIVGHNAFSYGWAMLERQLRDAGVQDMEEFGVLDTLHLERKISKDHPEFAPCPSVQGHALEKAHERWGLPYVVNHVAIDDARIVWALFLRLCEVYAPLGEASRDEALELVKAEVALHGLGLKRR